MDAFESEAAVNTVSSSMLWKKFRDSDQILQHQHALHSAASKERKKRQLAVLEHIVAMRNQQQLPPFFAMITGPTIRPYRMESLRSFLGRVTPRSRVAHVHLGSNPRISRRHVQIEYDVGRGCYCAINLSKLGLRVRYRGEWVDYTTSSQSIPLPNPATLDIQGVLVYVQAFYVIARRGLANGGPIGNIVLSNSYSPAPEKLRARSKPPKAASSKQSRTNSRASPGGVTYAHMIEQALIALGGQGVVSKISSYVAEHFAKEIEGKDKWKKTLSGVLSSNPKFTQVPGAKSGRMSVWMLKTPEADDEAEEAYNRDTAITEEEEAKRQKRTELPGGKSETQTQPKKRKTGGSPKDEL